MKSNGCNNKQLQQQATATLLALLIICIADH